VFHYEWCRHVVTECSKHLTLESPVFAETIKLKVNVKLSLCLTKHHAMKTYLWLN